MNFVPRDRAYSFRIEDCLPDFRYSIAEFEDDLWRNRRHIADNIRMARGDQEIYPATAPARQDGLQWIFQAIAAGYTAIFNKLNLCNPQVARLCCVIDRAFLPVTKTFVTAFLSPSSHSCFSYHYDEVDVFLIQIYGEKEWSVAAPIIPFPVEGMAKPSVAQNQGAREYLHTTLRPGDVLYIPRGHVHKGSPGRTGSLHLSAGVHVQTVAEGISDWLKELSFESEPLRRPMTSAEIDRALSALPIFAKPDREELRRADILYLPGSMLQTSLQINNLNPECFLRRVLPEPIDYVLSPDLAFLEVRGKLYDYGIRSETRAKTILPAGYFSALQHINGVVNFSVQALADENSLTGEDATEMCRRLLTIGVLEVVKC